MTSPVEPTDLQLVERAAAGDRGARRVLFERHRDAAYRAALRITARNEDALDVVQDAFVKAFESLASFQRDSAFKTWLLRIVTNRALDLLRSRRVRRAASLDRRNDDDREPPDPPAPNAADADAAIERRELGERLRRALEELPIEQRAVFALYAEGEFTYDQIAKLLEVPIGTVMSRLFHARRRLSDLLADLAPGAERAEKTKKRVMP
ncbi:MAG: RNA polymerase sigma factor [Phycisphaerae bacterium]